MKAGERGQEAVRDEQGDKMAKRGDRKEKDYEGYE